MYDRWRVIDIA